MLIQSLEQKTRLALTTVVLTVVGCVAICGYTVFRCTSMIKEERNQIYVLDGQIPFLAERAQLETSFIMEAKAHINQFHQYFFNLPPDNEFIEWTVGKALYMGDGSIMKQHNALQEKGFYSDLVSATASCTVMCDSINVDEHTKQFTYYGKQTIKRRTKTIHRSMITTGYLENCQRSSNNPHGLLITRWKTIENKDLSH